MTEKAEQETIIEEQKPLSRSMLWRMQRDFYEEQGKDAWENKIPYFLTSNAFMAKAYAHVILGYLQDCGRDTRDPDQPIHIVELGAGSGRLSFLLIKKLQALRLQSPLPTAAFRYVMTDFTQKNIDFWRSHPALQPFINDGLLDFALFDAENDSRLLLQESGVALAPETNRNPVVAVANYLFDSLIQDVFRVRSGILEEGLATRYTNDPNLPDPQKTVKLEQIKVRYDFKPVPRGYYQDPEFDQILHGYRDRLCDSIVCFPIGALRCIRSLMHLSNNRLFLLSGDKGRCCEQDLITNEQPVLTNHEGCFSLLVNYHAIGQYFRNKNSGLCCYKKSRDGLLCIAGFVSGEASQSYPATQFAWDEHIDTFGPGEFFDLFSNVLKNREKMPLLSLLSMIRLSDYDSIVFCKLSDAISNALADISHEHETRLFKMLEHVWDTWYCMQESGTDANQIAKIYYHRHCYAKCISINKKIMEHYGENPSSLFNIGICLYKIGMVHHCLAFFDRALEIDNSHFHSRAWRIRVQDQLHTMGPYEMKIPAAPADLLDFPVLPMLLDLLHFPKSQQDCRQ
jgi:hypothetical protein